MNIFKKFYCRAYQTVFKLMLPILPYREPKLLHSNLELVQVLQDINAKNVLLVTDKGIRGLKLTERLEKAIKKASVNLFVYDGTVPNPTTDNVANALKIYKENECDCLIAFGGGSVMDCAKAVGARVARPNKTLKQMKGVLKVGKKIPTLIAVPTTAGTGSETTLAAVITDSNTRHKYAINDFPLIPSYAMLDPELTVGLPRHITSTTGMDALTHAIEAYIGRSTTKETRQRAKDAVRLVFENILEVYNDGSNIHARENMLTAAYYAGIAFTKSYVGYVHAIAHSLGGKYNIAHGYANAVILPYMLKKYGKSVYKKLYELAVYAGLVGEHVTHEEGALKFIKHIEYLNQAMNIGTKIEGIEVKDITELASTAEKEANPLYPVPKLFTAKELEKIYYEIRG